MKARLEDKRSAIRLRKQGLSYKEIQEKVNVSKGLMSGWFKYLELTDKEQEFLKSRMKARQDRGRLASTFSNRERRMEREKAALNQAEEIFKNYFSDPLFIMGVVLYWAEGSKRSDTFHFINSDPEMIVFMDRWVKRFLQISQDKIQHRLYLHRIPGYEGCEEFWSKKLGIEPQKLQKTTYKPTRHSIKKNPDYKGCCRITVFGVFYLRLMKAWQKLLMQYYGERI